MSPFLDLSITNDIFSSKMYGKWDNLNFEIHVVNFQFLAMEMFLANPLMLYIFRNLYI